ncbi:hypothetical protein ID866_3015 [Astraeus odoratus]|nr:hypothetical protein ID866_3015 [Astraeus odoratus]
MPGRYGSASPVHGEVHLPLEYKEDLEIGPTDKNDLDLDARSTSSSDAAAQGLSVSISPSVLTGTTSMLLSSERAYASDLAMIRDIHIPLALGQHLPFSPNRPTPLSSSGSGSGSDSSPSTAATALDYVRIIFGNIQELAVFADRFVSLLEEAIGSSIDSGSNDDRVGALFLEIVRDVSAQSPYKTCIIRHHTAIAHLAALPSSPALSAYLAHTRTLVSSLSYARDLLSLLIKPVQRLSTYSRLLAAIIDATPDSHSDRAALIEAKKKMEEVRQSANEESRRREVVRDVPVGTGGTRRRGSNAGLGHAGGRKHSCLSKVTEIAENGMDNAEAAQVAHLESELQRYATFIDRLLRDVKGWRNAMQVSLVVLRQWGITFGTVLGLTPSLSAFNPDVAPDSPNGQVINTADPDTLV